LGSLYFLVDARVANRNFVRLGWIDLEWVPVIRHLLAVLLTNQPVIRHLLFATCYSPPVTRVYVSSLIIPMNIHGFWPPRKHQIQQGLYLDFYYLGADTNGYVPCLYFPFLAANPIFIKKLNCLYLGNQ
jgi:hypothetical protein